jgi:hypothetical protein
VTDIIVRIASNAPLTIKAAKQTLAELIKTNASPDTELCDRLTERCLDSYDYREGYEAFLQKRTPRFQGGRDPLSRVPRQPFSVARIRCRARDVPIGFFQGLPVFR